MLMDMPLAQQRKSKGHRILRCGTPHARLPKLDSVTLTSCVFPIKYDLNHLMFDTPIA